MRAELVPPRVKGRFRGRPKPAVDNLGSTKVTGSLSGSDHGDQLSYEIRPGSFPGGEVRAAGPRRLGPLPDPQRPRPVVRGSAGPRRQAHQVTGPGVRLRRDDSSPAPTPTTGNGRSSVPRIPEAPPAPGPQPSATPGDKPLGAECAPADPGERCRDMSTPFAGMIAGPAEGTAGRYAARTRPPRGFRPHGRCRVR
ncbi:hypothetical protein B6E66_19345 [Streptomyces maremycinicus]|nr:hypothetical protein B6E66_19345 [Streptomyces sp. B9173]